MIKIIDKHGLSGKATLNLLFFSKFITLSLIIIIFRILSKVILIARDVVSKIIIYNSFRLSTLNIYKCAEVLVTSKESQML